MTATSTLREPGSVARVGGDTFQVVGRQGDVYQVTIRPGDVRCTCPAGRYRRHCWHLDRVGEHLADVARRSGTGREVFTAGLVWVRFRVLGHLLADGAVELVGKVRCSYCSDGPLTVSAPAGDWSRVICPTCGGRHRCQPAGAAWGEAAMEKRIGPRMLEPWRLAEIEQVALARDDEDARMLRELLSHAAYHETIGLGSYFTSFADAVAREERDRMDTEESRS